MMMILQYTMKIYQFIGMLTLGGGAGKAVFVPVGLPYGQPYHHEHEYGEDLRQ
jgi:hypothetical protein